MNLIKKEKKNFLKIWIYKFISAELQMERIFDFL